MSRMFGAVEISRDNGDRSSFESWNITGNNLAWIIFYAYKMSGCHKAIPELPKKKKDV